MQTIHRKESKIPIWNINVEMPRTNAPNKSNAIKFIEYLTGDVAQEIFASGNNEYPVVSSAESVPVLKSFGEFREDQVNAAAFGRNNATAVEIMDRAGWR